MPVYEFACQGCGAQVTLSLFLEDYEKKKSKCPECGSEKLDRLITSFAVQTSPKS
jgi:putative FmdB family regulatory protein